MYHLLHMVGQETQDIIFDTLNVEECERVQYKISLEALDQQFCIKKKNIPFKRSNFVQQNSLKKNQQSNTLLDYDN